jgi:YfiR/HmsC-like
MKKTGWRNPGRWATGWLRPATALLGLAAWLAGACSGYGGEPSFTEYQVKALFLFNFTKYVDWPVEAFAETNTPITIGVYGENKFGDDLPKAVSGKSVGGRAITVRRIENTDDLGKCHILFIGGSDQKHLGEILDKIKALPVLTVGETDQFAEQGGVIHFTKKDGKVRLEINLQAAQRANLQISSKLLSVADVVKGKSK